MLLVKQSASKVVPFFMVDSSDHISPKTGLSPSVQISKAGGTFAAAGGTVAEIGNGWYRITLSTTDTNTLGSLAFYITATGADPVSFSIQVVAFDPESSTDLGLSRIDANISSRAPASTALSNATWTDARAAKLDNLDATVSSRSTLTAADVWGYTTRTLTSFGTLVSDIWNHSTRTLTSFGTLVSDIWNYSTRTLTEFSTSLAVAVWDVLESAISTTNSIGLKVKDNLDTTVSSRASGSDYTAARAAKLDNLDATISSRASGSDYTAARAAKLDNLDATISSRASGSDYTAARAAKLDNLDATISSRAPASTALSNETWTDARAAKLDNLDTTVSSRSTLTATDVWNYTSRTLTSFGTLVSDIWNYSTRTLTAFSTSLAVSVWDVLESAISVANSIGIKVKTNLDATVSSRSTLTASQAADAVWDETLADHQTSGSTGAALAAAGSAGDPWATQLPGSYGSGTAGYILGNRLDVAVSTRSTLTAAQAADAVWDEPLANHQETGSAGAALSAAGSAGDPWATQLPGSYGSGTAGNILGNRLDVAVSTRSTLTASDVWNYTTRTITSFGTLVSDIWNHSTRTLTSFGTLVSDIWSYSTRTLTSFSTSLALAVWDVLESAITTANSIGVKVKNNLDTSVSSRAPASTALSNTTWTDSRAAKLDNLDATISSRASGSDYTAARAAKLDNLDATVSSRAPASTALSNATWTDARAAKLDNLDATVSSRAPASTALSNTTWTNARAAKLDNLDATVSSRSTLTASDVWNHTTRTLTSFGSLVSDIWGYATNVGTSAVTVLERVYRTLVNKMKVNKSTGSVTLYADNDSNTAATGTITESDTEVTRNKLSWQ
jgi:hypothetical protein